MHGCTELNSRAAAAAAQESVLAAGCVGALVGLTGSPEGELRLNAVWALQNLVYSASSEVRAALLAALPWRAAVDLTNDIHTDVQARPYPANRSISNQSELWRLYDSGPDERVLLRCWPSRQRRFWCLDLFMLL